jgi:hypothetical protein
VALKVQAMTPSNATWGCYFTRSKSNLNLFERKEDQGVVQVKRTEAFNQLVELFNQGKILFPKNSHHESTVRQHLGNLTRLSDYDVVGEEMQKWVSTGEDHFAFALLYAWLASEMVLNDTSAIILPESLRFASKVRMRG